MKINDTIIEQIMAIRKMPNCPNMFDYTAVQRIASDNWMPDLVIFIEENRREYAEFILGKR